MARLVYFSKDLEVKRKSSTGSNSYTPRGARFGAGVLHTGQSPRHRGRTVRLAPSHRAPVREAAGLAPGARSLWDSSPGPLDGFCHSCHRGQLLFSQTASGSLT